jgi:phosphoribosylamine--glycine ligase
LAEKCFAEVFLPTVKGLEKSKIDFKGILYFGLMVTGDKINVLEYNVRMGDPETQVVLPRLKTDLVDVMMATIEGRLSEVKLSWDERSASTIVAASKGYPESYEKGKEITGLDEAEGVTIYHAGTKLIDGRVLTSGGRVLAVTTLAETLEASLGKGYNELKKIHFDGIYYRRDIGI